MKLERLLWDSERFGITPAGMLRRAIGGWSSRPPLFLTSIPKSGTHLIERAICLMPGTFRPIMRTLNSKNIGIHGGWENVLAKTKQGRLLVTHAHYSEELSRQVTKNKFKAFFLVRDPRSMILSNMYWVQENPKHQFHKYFNNLTDEQKIDFLIDGQPQNGFLNYLDTMQLFLGWLDHPNVLCIRFEDLANRDLAIRSNEVARISSHAEVALQEDQIRQISGRILSSSSPTFRAGGKKNWRTALSAFQIERINQRTIELRKAFGYE